MDIQILGPGCKRCDALTTNTREALAQLGSDASIAKIADPVAIASMGVMATPGLAIDGKVVVAGTVPSVESLKGLLAASLDVTSPPA